MIFRRFIVILYSFFIGFSAMTLSASSLAAEPTTETAGVIGWIDIEPASGSAEQGQLLTITAHALALRATHGRYSLEVKRKGKGGVSNTRQGGAIDLKSGASAVLSRNGINIGPADSIDIELKIFIDDREVFSAAVKSVGDGGLRL
jgi:hypothetical protein